MKAGFRKEYGDNMAIYYGIDSNYASSLFSSLNTGNKSNSTSDLTSLLSDYSSIRSGSYKKLLNAYYSESDGTTKNKASISTAEDSTKKLKSIKSAADELSNNVKELTATGSKSVFKKVDTKDENGNKVKDYDKDAIYKAVKSFVDDYNSLIEATDESNTKTIVSGTNSMISTTKANTSLLRDLGISVNSDFTLDIDEDTFKKADMAVAKSMFSGTGSYAYQISVKSAMVSMNATNEASKSNTYTSAGNYSYNYSAGDLYNSWF